MSIFGKLTDVLKEVFWLKSSKKKVSPKRRVKTTRKKIVKKTVVKKKIAPLKPAKALKPVAKKAAGAVIKPLKAPKTKVVVIDPNLVKVGEITHYFDRLKVAVVKLTHGSILIGDKLNIIGPKTKFLQKVWSMQIESLDVKVAKKGQLVGLKVDKVLAVGDSVYK